MAADKQITLITGGNSGIGFALAALLIEDQSQHVLVCSRSVEKGEAALRELQSLNRAGSVEMLHLEVTSSDSISAAFHTVEEKHGRLDALVNNAAQGRFADDTPLTEQLRTSFEVNCIGAAAVVEAFAPLMRKSTTTARIINVSSGAGSLGLISESAKHPGPDLPIMMQYRSSKAALNMISACHTKEYEKLGWKVFTYCPGFTVSNLGPYNKAEYGAKPTVEGARPMVAILNGERDAENGCFVNSEGGQHPW